jgi:hypothetical protein
MKQHPFYEPTNEFIERHGLHIDEAETWVELSDKEDNGFMSYHEGHVFEGYLPDEAALNSVIAWTLWDK